MTTDIIFYTLIFIHFYKGEFMNQSNIALKLGVSRQFISKWINGKSGISVSTAMRWSTILNIDFKILITAEPKRKIREKLIGLDK